MLSAFDLYSIGIGPSSSHTVGPMRAAKSFVTRLSLEGVLSSVERVRVDLFGSLGATGHGHGSDKAVILGLEGEDPATVDTNSVSRRFELVKDSGVVMLDGTHPARLNLDHDLVLHRRKSLPEHPNGIKFIVFGQGGTPQRSATYYSVGGGFVVDAQAIHRDRVLLDDTEVAHRFTTGGQLLRICREEGASISDIMLANELSWRSEAEVRSGLLHLWSVMAGCIRAGFLASGVLPGGLNVPRRAPGLHAQLSTQTNWRDPLHVMDWVNLYALSVNEENASGGRIVTAPTNGAAGVIPAVLRYYTDFIPGANDEGIIRFLLTAAAIGIIIKENASISGAEVGCQGEVGAACAMAAAGLTEALGGRATQVENAAEVGLEHNLGLTCDPVGGLVQIPCIERNAIAAVKAINAARLAMHGTGVHKVSLDEAVKAMRDTGRDMNVKYKETSRGGLAVNVIEC